MSRWLEEAVMCFERRLCCCIANDGFTDASQQDDMKGADKGIAKAYRKKVDTSWKNDHFIVMVLLTRWSMAT